MNEIYETKLNVILFSRYERNTFDELLLKTLKKDHYAIFCLGRLKVMIYEEVSKGYWFIVNKKGIIHVPGFYS